MTIGQAAIYGIVQGLTEFLPISSTAHLYVVPQLLGWGKPATSFVAVIQLGTLVAVVWYFWREVWEIGRDMLLRGPRAKLGWMIAVGTVPVIVCGLLFKDAIEGRFTSLYVISGSLIGLALVLWLAEVMATKRRTLEQVGWADAIVVGLAQTVALMPGSSRSGVTMTGGLFMGLTRETAARFSFLLSLPSIFAAGIYQLVKGRDQLFASEASTLTLAVATIISGVVGYASIAFLLGYLKKHTTYLFIVYRLIVGFGLLWLLHIGKLQPL
ncbi:MAG: undecaprenyl-diphosphatase UppP [Verrucomicrobiae bacterium]|nr:undecaprenyl-diphosphatase UppP [Verrucomicrobiae bacterium]